jgi:hypothetical protein
MTGFCGVGVMLRVYRFQQHAKCPRCEDDDKTIDHVLQCRQQSALDLWSKSIQDLERWMTTNQGHPEMIELIILGLAGMIKYGFHSHMIFWNQLFVKRGISNVE